MKFLSLLVCFNIVENSPIGIASKPQKKVIVFDAYEMMLLINTERNLRNIPSLIINPKLIQISQLQSNYQAWAKKITHVGPKGDKPGDRAKWVGYNYNFIAENVAHFNGDTKMLVKYLMSNNQTATNLFNSNLVQFGAAVNNFYWTVTMAAPK